MNRFKTMLLLSLLTVLMVAMGSAIGGKSGMVFAFVLSLGMNFSYWFTDKIVLRMYGAKQIGEQDHPAFFGMVRRLAQQAELPVPKVHTIPDESPNAFATGRNPEEGGFPLPRTPCRRIRRQALWQPRMPWPVHYKNFTSHRRWSRCS